MTFLYYVNVNVNHKCNAINSSGSSLRFIATWLVFQQAPALVGKEVDLGQHHLDVFALLLEMRAPAIEPGKKLLELLALVAGDVVQLEQLADFGEGEAQALAAQGELQAHPATAAEDPVGALPPGTQEALVLVEADGPGAHVKFFGERRDRVGSAHCAAQQCHVI